MNYPTLNIKAVNDLLTILDEFEKDPKYLDPEVCPYDPGTIKKLMKLIKRTEVHPVAAATVTEPKQGRGRPKAGPAIPVDEVEKEINDIRQELASLKIEGQTMETSERLQIVKTRAALIERVLGMKERVADVKKYHAFVKHILSIMEEELPPVNRERVIEELKKYSEE